jgi:hypothetical protein
MKRFALFLIVVLVCANTQGQDTTSKKGIKVSAVVGKLYMTLNMQGWFTLLEIGSNLYELRENLQPIRGNFPPGSAIIGGVEYFDGDMVIIAGNMWLELDTNEIRGLSGHIIPTIDIDTIEKRISDINVEPFLSKYTIDVSCIYANGDIIEGTTDLSISHPYSGVSDMNLLFGYPYSPFYSWGFEANGLTLNNDTSFFIEKSTYISDIPYIEEGIWGEGYIKDDSIFANTIHAQMYFRHTDSNCIGELLVSESCEYRGAKIKTNTDPISNFNKIEVYYNSAEQTIVIELKQNQSNQLLTIELFDMQGRMVTKKMFSGNYKINISSLPKGVYIYHLLQNNQQLNSGKVLKL